MILQLGESGHLSSDEKQKLEAHIMSAENAKALEPLVLVSNAVNVLTPRR